MELLSQYYEDKLTLVRHMNELARDNPQEVENVLLEVNNERHFMKAELKRMKEEVSAWRMELDKAKRCVAAMKTYSEINQEMLENIPPQALKKSALSPKIEVPTAAPSSGQVEPASNVSVKTKPSAVVVTAQVTFLTVAEFEKVPKYMKGRLNYEALTLAVEEFNKCVHAKYEFLARPLSEIGLKDKKRRNVLKSQDKPDLKHRNFVTAEELKDYSMFRTEAGRKSVVTVLRHFQKIRESRGPGPIVRFVVC